MPDQSNLLPISALQYLLFCERQCALIHIEQVWSDNQFTAEGNLLHERTHAGPDESRPGIRITRGMPVRSLELGLSGNATWSNFIWGTPAPRPLWKAPRLQLCNPDRRIQARGMVRQEYPPDPVPSPWMLIYYEAYLEQADAEGREHFSKTVPVEGSYGSNWRRNLAKPIFPLASTLTST